MLKQWKTIALVLLALLLFPGLVSAPALAAEPELQNGELSGDGIPEGWTVDAYLPEDAAVFAEGGVVTITAKGDNDVRLTQIVAVEPDTVYTLSAEIAVRDVAGGKGASLSIDNYSLDGSFIYSESLLGQRNWQRISLSFYTGPEQTEVKIALRLGGYSELSRGTAQFRSVSFVSSPGGMANAVSLAGGESAAPAAGENSEARKIQLKSYLHLFVVVSVTIGCVLLYGVYRSREELAAALEECSARKYYVLAVLAGLVLRSILASLWGGHDSDMSCWTGWGSYIAQYGPSTFYTAPGHEWYDYPPAYMLVLGFIARLLQVFHIPMNSDGAVFAFILPAYIADVAIGALLMRTARKQGFSSGWQLLLGILAIFNPAAVVLSGAWGQIDSILTLFLLLSLLELNENRRITAGALFGLAIMIKWQALIYGPVLAAAFLLRIRRPRDLRDTVLAVAAALAVIFVLSLPFRGDQGVFWIVDRFLHAAGGYDYASVEAYNFQALIGGNWKNVNSPAVLWITYKMIGIAGIAAAVIWSVWYQIRSSRRDKTAAPEGHRGDAFLSAGFCMYMIFTFGHYMHERYVFPVMYLLLFAFVYFRQPRLLFASLLLSVILFLNETTAMYVVSNLAMSVVRSSAEHKAVIAACSLAEVTAFLLFLIVFLDMAFWTKGGEVRRG